MQDFNPQEEIRPRLLATDLDGTFLPLTEADKYAAALRHFHSARENTDLGLIFATGRHFESVLEVIGEQRLPLPDWLVCDVGTSVYRRQGESFTSYEPYREHLGERTGGCAREQVAAALAEWPRLIVQEPEHQKRYKISYECEPDSLREVVDNANRKLQECHLPFSATGSVDPFRGCGLIDVLPEGVSKAHALLWLSTHGDFRPGEVVYAGDSGNDLAALTGGFRAIVVGNAAPGLIEEVRNTLRQQNRLHRLYVAEEEATCGVLEGCRHFKLL